MKIPRVPVLVLRNGKTHRETAMVLPETSVDIKLNNRTVAGMVCRPDNPEEPSIGLLCHYDVFHSPEVIKSIRVYPKESIVSIQARIEKKAVEQLARAVSAGDIFPSNSENNGQKSLRRKTDPHGVENSILKSLSSMAVYFHEALELKGIFGAYHVAALADKNGKSLCQAGDVGMNTTVDRVLGKAFLSGTKGKSVVLLISGRLRAGLVQKAAYHGIRIILTTSMVTHLALETALQAEIDIVQAKENGTLTIYSGNHSEIKGKSLKSAGEA